MQRWISRASSTMGAALIVVGLVLIYLARYGRNLFYSQTYNYVASFLPPIFDVWTLLMGLHFVFMLALLALMPRSKFRMMEFAQASRRRRRIIASIALLLSGSASLFLISGTVFRFPRVVALLARTQLYMTVVAVGAAALVAFAFAIYPKALRERSGKPSFAKRIGGAVLATLLLLFVVAVVEVQVAKPPAQQMVVPSTRAATHDVSAIVVDPPKRIGDGDSTPLEIRFRATPHARQRETTAYRYPVSLPSGRKYGVAVSFRAAGFDVAAPTDEQLKPRELVVNEPLSWTWIITPKEGKAGSTQTVAFNLFIKELPDGKIVFDSPVTSIQISVDTPLGLPKWLVSTDVAVGSILGGLLGLLFPVFSDRLKARRAASDAQEGAA